MSRTRIWDLPTRVFHWALVVLIAAAYLTQKLALMEWHGRIGLSLLGLLAFRIAWGFLGSTYARFASLGLGIRPLRAYLRGEWQGLGHNPLGALSVLAILGTVALQAGSGLFANDDIDFSGPLAAMVSGETAKRFTNIHSLLQTALLVLVGAHVAAIAYHLRVKKNNLIKPMITGWKAGRGEPARGGGMLAFVFAAFIAGATVFVASGNVLPVPQAVASVPDKPAW